MDGTDRVERDGTDHGLVAPYQLPEELMSGPAARLQGIALVFVVLVVGASGYNLVHPTPAFPSAGCSKLADVNCRQ